MKVDPACFPCALSRALCTARHITDDPWLHHKLLDKAMQELLDSRKDVSPAELMFLLEGVISKTLGSTDPYQKPRSDWHDELQALLPRIQEKVSTAEDPLEASLLLSARANVFDNELLGPNAIRSEIKKRGFDTPDKFAHSDLDLLVSDLRNAQTVLFIHDSGPEFPFDREVLRCLHQVSSRDQGGSGIRSTCVVRSKPILLDAVEEDFERYQMLEVPGVAGFIDPGISALGIPLNECSREFREQFDQADLVIAKGQAHFETLEGCGRSIYHLMRVKCDVMAKNQGVRVGDLVFLRTG